MYIRYKYQMIKISVKKERRRIKPKESSIDNKIWQ